MQDADLLRKHPPNNEQRFNPRGQVGLVLDQLPDAGLELHRPGHADLEAELRKVPRRSFWMAIAFDNLVTSESGPKCRLAQRSDQRTLDGFG